MHPINHSNIILCELINNQRKNIHIDKKLSYNDLKRLSKYLSTSIFNNECSLWKGYITIIKHDESKSYINFFFRKKKYALHRLLYNNFVNYIDDSEYIKFKCPNKGKCCNINHFYKNIKTNINLNNDNIINKHNIDNDIIVNFI
jgi:hypothetical protein